MVIDEFFRQQYLIPGKTYDNFIFESCPDEFLYFAQKSLSQKDEEVKSCVISINRQQEERIEKTLNFFSEEFQKQILARDFITASVIKELLGYTDKEKELKDFLIEQLNAFINNDYDKVKQLHSQSLMPFDVKKIARSIGKIELNFFLNGTQNKFLQQAINIYISSREPYSVKIFTNSQRLPTYYDINGNLIECPHDFMRRDINKFIGERFLEREQ